MIVLYTSCLLSMVLVYSGAYVMRRNETAGGLMIVSGFSAACAAIIIAMLERGGA